jgi:formate hydrogenlyase subunit 6/NADH:ubiquinone oxidoreductase subunit I
VDCGVCGRVCPKGAIVDAAGNQTQRIPRKDWSKPVIDTANCSACGICVNMWCTAGALGITRPQFRGDINAAAWLADAKKCVGCGLCASECPMGAVRMESEKVCSTARHC